jgi:protein subunit release factor A
VLVLYILSKSPAKIAASSPPAAALISTITSFSSLGSSVDVYRDYKSKKEEIAEIDEMLNETEDKEEIEMLKDFWN